MMNLLAIGSVSDYTFNPYETSKQILISEIMCGGKGTVLIISSTSLSNVSIAHPNRAEVSTKPCMYNICEHYTTCIIICT